MGFFLNYNMNFQKEDQLSLFSYKCLICKENIQADSKERLTDLLQPHFHNTTLILIKKNVDKNNNILSETYQKKGTFQIECQYCKMVQTSELFTELSVSFLQNHECSEMTKIYRNRKELELEEQELDIIRENYFGVDKNSF